VMGPEHGQSRYRGSAECIDTQFAVHNDSNAATTVQGALMWAASVRMGAMDELLYPQGTELSCAACSTHSDSGAVYEHWGSTTCNRAATILYTGIMSGAYWNYPGSNTNYLCLHPNPELPEGHSTGNAGGNLIYGAQYENTGTLDGNLHGDAACTLCLQPAAQQVYVQWGRQTCSHGQVLEYAGFAMSSHYTHGKSEYICVDPARATHYRSSTLNEAAALLYVVETEAAAMDVLLYPENRELGCAVCSVPLS
jgi:hypothetical protein